MLQLLYYIAIGVAVNAILNLTVDAGCSVYYAIRGREYKTNWENDNNE